MKEAMSKLRHNIFILTLLLSWGNSWGQKPLVLESSSVKMRWENSAQGWQLKSLSVKKGQTWTNLKTPSGENTLLYAAEKPSEKPEQIVKSITGEEFPGPKYHYQTKWWAESISPVSLNTAGKAFHFFAKNMQKFRQKK